MSSLVKAYKQYPLRSFVWMAICLIRTKLFYKSAKIIRFPFDIRGRSHIALGKQFTSGYSCRLEAYPRNNDTAVLLKIGDNVEINDYVHITAMEKVVIGNNVLIASKVYISDCSHGIYSGPGEHSSPLIPPNSRSYQSKPVILEDNVWLGEFVSVLPGVSIGKGTIVGANSVVSKDLPPFVIAVGIPAVPIKKFNFENQTWEKI